MSQSLNLSRIRALIVDDEPSVRIVLRKILAEWGADVVEAESGPGAIVELKRARDGGGLFQLVILDSTLSPMDGFEVAERIKANPAELARTVLMLGPDRITEEITRARGTGAGGYVVKPLTRPALIGAIASLLNLEPAPASAPPEAKPTARFRLLLAEDSSDSRFIITKMLSGPDYQVDAAPDGGIAVDLFRMYGYDLVLMDLQMPSFDGYWATHEIRAWEQKNQMKRTPIIAVTAFPREEDPVKSFRAGLDGYLVKPVTRETLLKVIQKHLRRPGAESASSGAA